jgi:hypothetical protein
MRAQFVRGIDPKDSMNIGNKHAREAQKMIEAFKNINPEFSPKISDDKTMAETGDSYEVGVVSLFIDNKIFSLSWINSGLEYYMASWGYTDNKSADNNGTFQKLEQAMGKIINFMQM